MAIKSEPYDPAEDLAKYKDVVDQPPSKAKPAAPRKSAPVRGAAKEVPLEQIRSSIEDMYILAGGFLGAMPKFQMVGTAISEQAAQCAESIIAAAEADSKLRSALSKLFKAGKYSGIVTAHLPIVMALYMSIQMDRMAKAQQASEPVDTVTDVPNPSPVWDKVA